MRSALKTLEAKTLALGLARIGELCRTRSQRHDRSVPLARVRQMMQGVQNQPSLRHQQCDNGKHRKHHAKRGAQPLELIVRTTHNGEINLKRGTPDAGA